MSVSVKTANGIFKADDSPYKATALKAYKEMKLKYRDYYDIAREVRHALRDRHLEYDWYSLCTKEYGHSSLERSSILKLKRDDDDNYLIIVAVHD